MSVNDFERALDQSLAELRSGQAISPFANEEPTFVILRNDPSDFDRFSTLLDQPMDVTGLQALDQEDSPFDKPFQEKGQ